jgi:P-type E1-E2 ATPase
MIEIDIPGHDPLQLLHVVCDVNGTLAVDGRLVPGVEKALKALRAKLEIHLLTADTHGRQAEIDQQLGLQAQRIAAGGEAEAKAAYVGQLGAGQVVAIGQGANDAGMLERAALGICILSKEGTAVSALRVADLVAPDILTALSLLQHPMRLVASLRR